VGVDGANAVAGAVAKRRAAAAVVEILTMVCILE